MGKINLDITKTLIAWLAVLAPMQPLDAYTDHRHARVDSAEQVLRSGRQLSDKELMDCYYTIVRGTLGNDGEKHNRYAQTMLALTYRMNALNMRENALYHLGLQHYGQDDFEKAKRYFLWALEVTDSMTTDKRYTEADIDDNRSQLYGALGNLYNLQDKALLAIEYYQKALPIFERHGWLESQTILHHNVAELWSTMGNNEKAEQEYLRAIETGKASGDSLMTALPRKGLAKIYLSQDDYEKTRQTLEPAYAYYHAHRKEEANDYAEILASMTKLHLMSGHEDLNKAKIYVREALSYAAHELMTENRLDLYAAATMVAMKEGRWQEALAYGLKSIHDKEEEVTLSDVGCFEMLAMTCMHLGRTEEAGEYIRKVRATMERFATSHYQSGLSQMEVIYETQKKETAIGQLKREKQWYLWGGILTALLLLSASLTFCLLWLGIRQKRRTALIQARLDGEIAERIRTARDLHDRLGGTLTALKQNIAPSEQTAIQLANEAIREMRNVSHHLLPDSLSRYGLRTALRDFCQTLHQVSFSFTGTERRIAHEEAVYCIVYELVNNAVKSSQATHIAVQLMIDERMTIVTVSDNGIGLQMPAANSEGTGLNNIRQRVEAIGGTLSIDSNDRQGTEINIEIGP